MKNKSSNQKQKATIKWVVDGSFFFLVFVNVFICCKLMFLKKCGFAFVCSYVKAMNEPNSYCGVLDGLWRWWAWQDALVGGSKEWACNWEDKKMDCGKSNFFLIIKFLVCGCNSLVMIVLMLWLSGRNVHNQILFFLRLQYLFTTYWSLKVK